MGQRDVGRSQISRDKCFPVASGSIFPTNYWLKKGNWGLVASATGHVRSIEGIFWQELSRAHFCGRLSAVFGRLGRRPIPQAVIRSPHGRGHSSSAPPSKKWPSDTEYLLFLLLFFFWRQVEGTLSVNLLDAHHELPRPSGQGLSRLTARSKMPRQFIATAVNRDGSSRAVMSDGQCDNRIRKEPLCASVLIEIIININIAFVIITIIARYQLFYNARKSKLKSSLWLFLPNDYCFV